MRHLNTSNLIYLNYHTYFFLKYSHTFCGLVDTGLMGHLSSENFLAAISVATSVIQ